MGNETNELKDGFYLRIDEGIPGEIFFCIKNGRRIEIWIYKDMAKIDVSWPWGLYKVEKITPERFQEAMDHAMNIIRDKINHGGV